MTTSPNTDSDQLLNKLFLRRVDPDKLIGALRGHDAFVKKVTGILNKQRPAQAHELLNPGRTAFGRFKSIAVTYLAFPTWLARFDPNLTRPLDVNINSYRYQRGKHAQDILHELIHIEATDSGKALLQAIEDAKGDLVILPFLEFSLYATPLFPGIGLDAMTGGWRGSVAYVYVTPHMWGSKGTARVAGPGSNADEVLFHEMVHGVRTLGTFKRLEGVPLVEEMIAVVMTNIYLAEKKQADMRDPVVRGAFSLLQRPEAWLNQDTRMVLAPLKWQQPTFFDALADIGPDKAWWNPLRDMKRESDKKAP